MARRLLFVTALFTLSVAPFACGGTDATIAADGPDATSDGTTLDGRGGPDTAASDTGPGNDGSSGGVDSAPRKDAGPRDSSLGDGAADAVADAVADAPPPYDGGPVNQCGDGFTPFTDRTNGGQVQRTIAFPVGSIGSFAYSVPCMRIKAGQTVQWDGLFLNHPMDTFGGTQPSPITLTNSGATKQFTFSTPGTYGFHCTVHATMIGAIDVVP